MYHGCTVLYVTQLNVRVSKAQSGSKVEEKDLMPISRALDITHATQKVIVVIETTESRRAAVPRLCRNVCMARELFLTTQTERVWLLQWLAHPVLGSWVRNATLLSVEPWRRVLRF
jgi:hypothetical protein